MTSMPRRSRARRLVLPGLALAGVALATVGLTLGARAAGRAPHIGEKAGQLDCQQCHSCAQPKAGAVCLKVCPSLFTARQTAPHDVSEAPSKFLLDRVASQYPGVQFDHKRHASMSEMGGGCAECHHFSPAGKISPCESCHAKDANAADLRQPGLKGAYHRQCLSCHREWSHDVNCNVCHLQAAAGASDATAGHREETSADKTDFMGKPHPILTPPVKRVYETPYEKGPVVTFYHQQHVELFGLRCVNCHQKENCSTCHDIKQASIPKKTMEQVHSICSSCHKTDTCATCHDTRERAGFSHATTGWPLSRFHSPLECRSCHPTGKKISKLNTECASCHRGWNDFRHEVTGLALDQNHADTACTDCHTNGNFTKTSCDGCHDDGRSAKKTPPGKYIPAAAK